MNDNQEVIMSPEENWLEKLRKNNKIWLVKEDQPAWVEWEYEPPMGSYYGRIGLRRIENNGAWCETWIINSNGKGLDGKQLALPIKGFFNENPPPLQEPEIRKIYREIERIEQKLEHLENYMKSMFYGSGTQAQIAYETDIEICKELQRPVKRVTLE